MEDARLFVDNEDIQRCDNDLLMKTSSNIDDFSRKPVYDNLCANLDSLESSILLYKHYDSELFLALNCPATKLTVHQLMPHRVMLGDDQRDQRLFMTLVEFSDPQGWLVTEYAPTLPWNQLDANIGGTLGIWTGASVISLVHMLTPSHFAHSTKQSMF